MGTEIFELFEKGSVNIGTGSKEITSIPWTEHKKFSGVFLKDIISHEETEGRLTCHLVRINPDSKIGLHTHPDSMELHEVISGSGVCITEHGELLYKPGSMAILKRGEPHEVVAGDAGLCLFAKFIVMP